MNTAPLPPPSDRTLLEHVLAHDRILFAALIAVQLLCWAWIVPMARDMYGSMNGPSAWMMTATWDRTHVLLLWAMWAVMMIGMMLPSASPLIFLYARLERGRSEARGGIRHAYALAAGYVAVWALFSIGATALQRVLSELILLSPMMTLFNPVASGALLVVAGLYQLTPLKLACLSVCRSPLAFFTQRWKPGGRGAWRMGVEHGTYCLGCCWALMLLLFVGGVMNLWVIVALTVFVLFEKLMPGTLVVRYQQLSGVLLMSYGLWLIYQ